MTELAASADGAGPSVWDTFSHTPGKVRGGDTGDIACDSYHRYREDVGLLASLGLSSYRFSISWPRVQPGGRGAVNQRGLDYYRGLLDELAGHGIAATATLYHWDLPQELQDEGGWANRDTAERFGEYAALTADALSDRVARWITLNEPQVVSTNGYRNGDHAPGLHGRYPENAPPALLPPATLIADGDLDLIKAPLDFLGVNYYSPIFLRAGDPGDLRRNENPARCQLPGVVEYLPPDLERTPMGWLVDPSGLHQILVEVSSQAPGLPLYVTENGCAAEDYVNPDGEVNDLERVRYLHMHLEAAARAIKDGSNLAGYFVWSLLDNFEWGWGYQKRFGIVFVDFGTQRRIPKASAAFYANVVRANAIPLLPANWPR